MNSKSFLIVLVLAMLACALPGAASPSANPAQPPASNADVKTLETIIVETAGAAQTQTAAALPTSTSTPSPTFTPSITPTFTPTFIFRFPTHTPLASYTSPVTVSAEEFGQVPGTPGTPGIGEGFKMSDKEWSCIVAGIIPPRNFEFEKKAHFDVYWTLFNNGTKSWPYYGVDLVYQGGYRHEGTKIQDFTRTVEPGKTVTVGASFIAPNKEGNYQTFFKLMVGKRLFCGMKYTFVVKE
jgi:hypothetical protein